MKPDIQNKEDIKIIVDTFYNSIRQDEVLGHIFDKVAHVNWDVHLPKMYNFWDNILFGTSDYTGKPFPPHMQVNEKRQLFPADFDRWENLFIAAVDTHYKGAKAEEMKFRARTIKEVWSFKINYINTTTI